MPETITINTDGACAGNPGPGGFAALIEGGDIQFPTITGGDPQTTNNQMELAAVYEALSFLNYEDITATKTIIVRSDSQYVIKAFNDNWIAGWQRNGWKNSKKQPVANQELWLALIDEVKKQEARGATFQWIWVQGHSGDPMNEKCDRLAVAERDHAPFTEGYWVSVGNTRSWAEHGRYTPPSMDRPAPAPASSQELTQIPETQADADPTAELAALKDGLRHALSQATDFEDFAARALQLL